MGLFSRVNDPWNTMGSSPAKRPKKAKAPEPEAPVRRDHVMRLFRAVMAETDADHTDPDNEETWPAYQQAQREMERLRGQATPAEVKAVREMCGRHGLSGRF